MNTKSLFAAVLFTIGAAVTAIGKNEPGSTGMAVVASYGSEIVKVIYKGENAGRVRLNIYNSQSKVVFSESRNSAEGFILPLNFSALEFGEYTIELTDASGTKTEKINYQPAKSASNVHISKLQDGKFLVSITSNGTEDINVKIYDDYNNLVHDTSNKVSGELAQLYSIKNLSGSCTFQISSKSGELANVSF